MEWNGCDLEGQEEEKEGPEAWPMNSPTRDAKHAANDAPTSPPMAHPASARKIV